MGEETKYRALSALKVRDFRLYWMGLVSQNAPRRFIRKRDGAKPNECENEKNRYAARYECTFYDNCMTVTELCHVSQSEPAVPNHHTRDPYEKIHRHDW